MAKKNTLLEEEKRREDLGFGTKTTSTQARLVLKNGDFNVKKIGQTWVSNLNLYHRLITMHWLAFGLLIILFYFLLNLVFATFYVIIGVENLGGIMPYDTMSPFWQAFFFSSQTLTTVGYGHINPSGYWTSFIAAIEALLGLMSFAIMTGLLYGRFARPQPKIKFSSKILVAPYLNINGLMFRMVNEKSNQLLNVESGMIFSKNEETPTGTKRKYYPLELERSKIKFLSLSWTVVHPITEESPLFQQTPESLAACDAEILVTVEGINDTYSDPIYARHSYLYNEVVWGAKFNDIIMAEGTAYSIDIRKVGEYKYAPLNV